MTPEQVKQIIRAELSTFLLGDNHVFNKSLHILNGRNIQLGTKTGTKIGTGTDQLLGFYNTTPVNQPATVTDPVGQANDLDSEARTAINALIDRLQELGLIA